jgi:hypothetical protein
MPLARIITRTPAQLAALSEYLRTRGYTVELVEPGTLRTSAAELEMDLDGCTAEEAMSRATRAAEGAQQRRAIAYDITGRPVAFADEEEDQGPVKGGNRIREAWSGLTSAWHEVAESLRLSAGRLGEWVAEGRQTIQEHRLRHQEDRLRKQEARAEALAEKDRERQDQALAREEERSRREDEERARRQVTAEHSRRLQEEAARQAAADRVLREKEEAARKAEQAAALERVREQQERTRQEESAERERRLMERYRKEARRDVVQERFQVEQKNAQQEIAPAESRLARREEQPPPSRFYQRDNDWKKAALAAVVIALLATLGYAAYENRQPAAPLSNRALVRSQSVSQPVPFGAATVPPPPATTPPQPNAKLPQSGVTSTAPAAPKPSARIRRARHARIADDTVADDEVVIHHAAATKKSSRTTASTQPKRISDLDQ